MPNTLAHIGVHTPITRGLIRGADLRWILLGCIIPDLAWILQRIVRALPGSVDVYDLRLYAMVMSTLFASLLLAGGLALLSTTPRRTFLVLALGSLLHLLMDALQIKWGNGVHLLAPFSWKLTSFELFWAGSWPSQVLTVLGLVTGLWILWRRDWSGWPVRLPSPVPLAVAVLLLGAYLILPWVMRTVPESFDNHSVGTLRHPERRAGAVVAFDRNEYEYRNGEPVFITWAKEELRVSEPVLDHDALVSIRAEFVDEQTIRILDVHEYRGLLRDLASYVGLGVVAMAWLLPGRRSR